MFVCVSVLKSGGGSLSRSTSTILPSEERDRDEKQKALILDGNCENATMIIGKGCSAERCAARRPIVPAVADKKVEDICFISFPVVGTCVGVN